MASTKTSGVYSITNTVDGKVYIGSSANIRTRWVGHLSELRGNRHRNKHLQNAWRKHGEKAFVFAVLEECRDEDIIASEQAVLDRVFAEQPCHDIYNTARCAEAPLRGVKASILTRLLMSLAGRGRKRTPETCARISALQQTPEARARMSAILKGKKRSEQTRQRISASKSGANHPNWGKPRSEETKRLIGASRQGSKHPMWGRHHSEESKRKTSATLLKNAALKRAEANHGI